MRITQKIAGQETVPGGGKSRVLLINDDEDFSILFGRRVLERGYLFERSRSLGEAMRRLQENQYDVVVVKDHMPDGRLVHMMHDFMNLTPFSAVVVCSSEATPGEAEEAVRAGVLDYCRYPTSPENLVDSMEYLLTSRKKGIRPEARERGFESVTGNSPQLLACLELAGKAAEGDISVLITGETGTGKELIAENIHACGPRAGKEFVHVDCASLPEHLVESILFGHEKGAFTSADRFREGLVLAADGGTLFLDEIGELPMNIQKSFLRVLDVGKFRRVGGRLELSCNFRLISATNRNLGEMVAAGRFREDLFYRIQSMIITIPPLRDRVGDLEMLVKHHLERQGREVGEFPKEASGELLNRLNRYFWPGNIRELFNALNRAVAAAGTETVLHPHHLPVYVRAKLAGQTAEAVRTERSVLDSVPGGNAEVSFPSLEEVRRGAVDKAEAGYLRELTRRARGDIRAALPVSGLSRSRFYALLKKHGLSMKR